jgi:hypothetical protein
MHSWARVSVIESRVKTIPRRQVVNTKYRQDSRKEERDQWMRERRAGSGQRQAQANLAHPSRPRSGSRTVPTSPPPPLQLSSIIPIPLSVPTAAYTGTPLDGKERCTAHTPSSSTRTTSRRRHSNEVPRAEVSDPPHIVAPPAQAPHTSHPRGRARIPARAARASNPGREKRSPIEPKEGESGRERTDRLPSSPFIRQATHPGSRAAPPIGREPSRWQRAHRASATQTASAAVIDMEDRMRTWRYCA